MKVVWGSEVGESFLVLVVSLCLYSFFSGDFSPPISGLDGNPPLDVRRVISGGGGSSAFNVVCAASSDF